LLEARSRAACCRNASPSAIAANSTFAPIFAITKSNMALRPITLITGASSGIGRELARVFVRHGHDLALVARRKDRLEALATEIEAAHARRPIVIVTDLEKPEALAIIAEALGSAGTEPQYLVNNAG